MPSNKKSILNTLFASFSIEAKALLMPPMEYIFLPSRLPIYLAGTETKHIYFPTSAIVSLISSLSDGSTTEVAIIGSEGMVGAPACLGDNIAIEDAIVQTGGYAYRVPTRCFTHHFRHCTSINRQTLRYLRTLIAHMSQITSCNKHHSIEQQMCRWILLTLDRSPNSHLFITHELLAGILGNRREAITLTAKKLKDIGAIIYKRGDILVVDREIIASLSCECYQVIKEEYTKLKKYHHGYSSTDALNLTKTP